MDKTGHATNVSAAPPSPVLKPQRRWTAAELLGEARTAEILLGDRTYTLRLTRSGKLILTR